MDDRETFTLSTIRHLIRFANLYARSEAMPIRVEDGIAVTTREAHAIQAIGDRAPISVSKLAAHFGFTKSAASQTVDRLKEKGFLEKATAPHSNREIHLTLTDLGWRAYRAHAQFHGEDRTRLLRCLDNHSPEQIATISDFLETANVIIDHRLED